jgi:hypothetical protein
VVRPEKETSELGHLEIKFAYFGLAIFTHVLPPLFLLNFILENMGGEFTQNINVNSP